MITGAPADNRRSAIRSRASSEGRVRLSTGVAAPKSTSALPVSTLPGRETNTGPLGGVWATLAARCTTRGRSSTRSTSTDHFTTGAAMDTRSS